MSYDENKNKNIDDGVISTDMIDEPLLIVLDEDDDDDEYENFDSTTTTTSSNSVLVNRTEEQTIVSNEIPAKGEQITIEVKNLIESLAIESNTKSKIFHRSSKSSNQLEKSNKSIRTIVIDTSFVQQTTQQQRRTKSISKRKHISTSNSSTNLSIDSVLSYISFDKVSNILTVSRMGSIYYIVEDLYIKIFSSLCTLDEFTNLLSKPEIIIFKQVTLSEKISITQQSPKLKTFDQIRYRLISIDSTDYLIKLKQLLLTTKNIEKIIDEMRSYKQASTSILLHDKVSTKHMSIDDAKQQKRFKSVKNCNIYSTNERLSKSPLKKTPNNNLTECLINKSKIYSSSSIENSHINNLSTTKISLHRLYRSKSLLYNKKSIENRFFRSYSLPSIKFDLKENQMFKFQSNITKSIDIIDDNYSMPMIVNVEENVQINNHQKIQSPEQSLSYSQSLNNAMSPGLPSNSIPYPYLYRSSSLYLTPIQTPYNLYYQESYPSSLSYQKSKESLSNHYDTQSKIISSSNNPSPMIMSILEKPIYPHSLTSEQQTPTIPGCLPCCSTDQSSISKDILPNERMIHGKYTPSSSLKSNLSHGKSSSSIHRRQQQHRISLTPYPPTKTYFAPLSIHYPCSQNSLMNETSYRTNVSHPKSPILVQNSSTIINPKAILNELRLPYIYTQSIDLLQAVIEHNHCDMDKIPKLVVRHTKTYLTKTIDTMGQLFPTWFNEPDYRCIQCFSCDQVFTPQLFMTHVDDEQLACEQPLNMTSIQLLTSEKMSEYKVELWNQFCTNLTIYASNFAEAGKFIEENKNQEKNCSTPIIPVTSILTVNNWKDDY